MWKRWMSAACRKRTVCLSMYPAVCRVRSPNPCTKSPPTRTSWKRIATINPQFPMSEIASSSAGQTIAGAFPPQVSIVLPCYMDAPHLDANVREIMRTLDAGRWSWEIILVNDKSPDRCEEIIDSLTEEFPHKIRKISHEVDLGRGMAVANGIRAARGALAGFLDVDVEVHCRYIPSLLLELEDGADVVCARRVYKLAIPLLHRAVLS